MEKIRDFQSISFISTLRTCLRRQSRHWWWQWRCWHPVQNPGHYPICRRRRRWLRQHVSWRRRRCRRRHLNVPQGAACHHYIYKKQQPQSIISISKTKQSYCIQYKA